MESSKRIWVWVGIVVVVIIVIVAIVWRPSKQTATGPTPVYAPQGQLTPNFPKDLILDPQAQIGTSYSLNYDSSTNQYTARWVSAIALAVLYNNYKTYFANNGWTITNSSGATSTSKIGALYAATSTANVNVTMIAQGTGNEVTITYVGHQ